MLYFFLTNKILLKAMLELISFQFFGLSVYPQEIRHAHELKYTYIANDYIYLWNFSH